MTETEAAETVAPLLATRVRKARAETICPRCRCLIRVGQAIGKVGWDQTSPSAGLLARCTHHLAALAAARPAADELNGIAQ